MYLFLSRRCARGKLAVGLVLSLLAALLLATHLYCYAAIEMGRGGPGGKAEWIASDLFWEAVDRLR